MKSLSKIMVMLFLIAISFASCQIETPQPTSDSGVKKATTSVQTDLSGHTTEQNNIVERYNRDNKPGSIKHLYIISAYSGQVLIYSTVKGKVTSSGKRLTPNTVASSDNQYSGGIPVNINGNTYRTSEVLQDDGTYGSSAEYIYWFDSKNIYHQQYITGGMMVHISDQPLAVKNVTLNMELTNSNQ